MSNVSRGIAGELRVAAEMQADGWLCASRRHVGGAGDILAVRYWPAEPGVTRRVRGHRLVEVKCRKNVWEGFRRADREALIATAEEFGCEPWLAWIPKPSAETQWLPPSAWP